MGIGELRGGKMGANGKMQYNSGWESGSMKTLAAHGLAGGIVQDRMGGKRPRLCPVCEFTTANHRDGATNNRIPNSIANHLKHIL
jgi:hypothetical protein